MSLVLLGKIIEDKDITDPNECLVMLALADATNKETMLCYPSLTRISQVARCSLRLVIYIIKRLEERGWIQVIRRKQPDGANLANTYRVIKYGDLVAQAVHQGSAPGAVGVVHPVQGVVHHASKGSAPGAPKPLIREPIREKKTPAGAGDLVTGSHSSEPEKTKPGRKPKDQAELTAYCASRGIQKSDADYLWDHWEGNGWNNGGKPIKDWQATVRAWKTAGYLPSQKRGGGGGPPPKDRDLAF